MTEVLIVIGALLVFCILTFGAAWLMAGWVGETPLWWRRKRSNHR
ncbi:hypothetical protein [Nocardioides seonyuensis]|nr:hypothetical protein [Nocardioides seonyuensis]